MTGYSIDHFTEQSMILWTVNSGWNMQDHLPSLAADLRDILDATHTKYALIVEMTKLQASLPDVIWGANYMTRLVDQPVFLHPKLALLVMVSNNPVYTLAALGLQSDVFGKINVRVFSTMEEAQAEVERWRSHRWHTGDG